MRSIGLFTSLCLGASLISLAACQPAPEATQTQTAPSPAPSVQEVLTPTPVNVSQERPKAMVAAANPLAVEAGLKALRDGGDVVDAAIAIQAVLGLVEPQSSGIGGGAFMLRYDAKAQTITVYDGRETAPSAVDETLFLSESDQPLDFLTAWTSGRAVGVPGVIAMLAIAHDDHGKLDWASDFSSAISLANHGFPVAKRLHDVSEQVMAYSPLDERPATASYFYDDQGRPWPIGHVLTNTAYAQTLSLIAADWRNFYEGPIALGIVEATRAEPLPGAITMEDLASYTPVKREALCVPYRSYQVCGAPPPASGGVAVGQIMGMLNHFDMQALGPTRDGWHVFIDANRLAYADRDQYVGDPDFVDVPIEGLLDSDYLASRAALITMDQALVRALPGEPPRAETMGIDASNDAPGTSHFVIRDNDGNVLSMTTTVESPFGSQRMTHGFLLNNQLTDFARAPRDEEGRLMANAPAAGKRPRSSMSPTIVLDQDNNFVLATGSPGGNSIIGYTVKSLVAMLDWGMTPGEAAAMPNVVARGEITRMEEGFDPDIQQDLRAQGHRIEGGRGEVSGIHIIRALPDGGSEGAADPRRDGQARHP
ncbi:gamma-glutamyltransferase family protein [Woodsholea maritima]|uniref:gamma-glutamyltransferase family protein n=1 Tax=Woodsholea maritima TaxID=240237 RepID=UPI00035C1C7A|nr:gamma-glutamyltransferase family protein [Woodsholea maritima]